jgi:hypothetical protein
LEKRVQREEQQRKKRSVLVLLLPVEEEEGRQRKYTARGEDKATVEEDAWIFGSRRWQG